jgi:hypothetical protein
MAVKTSRYRNKFDMEEDETLSIKDYKQIKEKKRYRNFDNALRSKNVDALLDYTEYDEDIEDDEYYEEDDYDFEEEENINER